MKNKNESWIHYQEACLKLIKAEREDIKTHPDLAEKIIQANLPTEYRPASITHPKTAILMIHGLLDSPFSYTEIGKALCKHGILSRSILLPGHGTRPENLLKVTYEQWIKTVEANIQSLKQEADQIILMGYSTGAALSLYHTLLDPTIAGLILLSPAIKVKAPVNIMVAWYQFTALFGQHKDWLCKETEIDYAKYLSVTFNAVHQVNALTNTIQDMHKNIALKTPMLMIASREDETISCHEAIQFFESLHHEDSKLILYTAAEQHYADTRIETRSSNYPDLNIKNFSHVSLPFSQNNAHYGKNGDYAAASHVSQTDQYYGAYNRLEVDFYQFLYRLGLTQHKRHELTYNPDFDYMVEAIANFVAAR